MKKRVVFFGFSVTRYGNPPYPVRLKQMMNEEGHEEFDIQFVALGGVSIECVPYITDHLQKLEPDVVVLEIATSHYSTSHKEISETKEILLQIIGGISTFCNQLDFLLLPRNDILNTCTISVALKELSLIHSFGIIDITDVFNADWGTYIIDYVHPTEKGIEKISSILKDYLLHRESLLIESNGATKISSEIKFKEVVSHYQYPLLRFFELSNFSAVALPLRVDEQLEFRVEKDCIVTGIFYIMGPDTSSLEINLEGDDFTVRTFDKFSYYYRIGYAPFYKKFPMKKNSLIKIKSSSNRLNTTLDKESLLKFDGILNYPISLTYDQMQTSLENVNNVNA